VQELAQMEAVMPGLYASAPETLPFAPSLEIRVFLLERRHGNVLVYSVTGLDSSAPDIQRAGGIGRQYLNHRHEAMFASEAVVAPLFCHVEERESVAATTHVRATFSRRHTLDDDFEVIPTPGHTSGASAFLWDNGEHRFLFTGDTIYLRGDEWVAAVLEGSSDRAAYLRSLELMRELDFDVLVPWAAGAGEQPYSVVSRAGPRRRIDAIIERVRAGADH
jgi:glyoxylase-like metal-dependent hydrolase (beta-lactamase superfamily II)